ncbi:MAG: sulfatase [Planctomycetes bacterium]|nr:sulfatase [Planctomycetota bacterium]
MVGTLGGLALAAAFGRRAALAADTKPNILFIMSDDHASHAMSCYGSRINKTPNLDRIATGGMRFENCFCGNSICGPSRAAILTGKHSHANGFRTNGDRFDGSQQTLPKLLKAAGYQTAIIGKWHLVTDPTGFDYWNILPGQGAYHDPMFIEMGERKKHQGYVTDLITDFSMDWLRKRDKSKPFFLMCHHKAPHRNWQPDAKHAKLYEDADIPEPPTFNDDYKTRGTAARTTTMTIENHLTKSDVKADVPAGLTGSARKSWLYQRYIKDYLRCVASVDDNVGRLLDFLDKEGLAQDTIVVYTSDQGFYLGDHGWYDKRFMYEESLRMPFIIRYPRAIKPGTVNRDLVQNIDFAPLFLDAAGQPTPADMHGRSFLPLLRGETPKDWRASLYYHYYEYPAVHSVKRHYGVRTQRHKLIHFYHDVDEWELYDLEKDPRELNNVYADPAYADTVKELKAELERLRAHFKVPEDKLPPPKAGKGK